MSNSDNLPVKRVKSIGQMRKQFARGVQASYGGSAEEATMSRIHAENEFDDWLETERRSARREVLIWLDSRLDAEELDMAAEHFGIEIEWKGLGAR